MVDNLRPITRIFIGGSRVHLGEAPKPKAPWTTQTPKASRRCEIKRQCPLSQPTKGPGKRRKLPSRVRVKFRPKTNLVHSGAAKKPLMSIILSILKNLFTLAKINMIKSANEQLRKVWDCSER